LINGTIYPADFDCTYQGANNTLMNGGISLNIGPGGSAVAIPLKAIGPIFVGGISANLNWVEFYSIHVINGLRTNPVYLNVTNSANGASLFYKPWDNVGEKTFPNYQGYANQYLYNINVPYCGSPTGTGTGRVFLGQRADGFSVNLGGIFDLINFVPIPGFPGAVAQSPLNNALANKNVGTFALEVQTQCVQGPGAVSVVGAWSGIRLLKHDPFGNHFAGAQVSRLGNPLVNEIVIGLRDKYVFNAGEPVNDAANGFGTYVLYPTFPAIVSVLFLKTVNQVLGVNLPSIAPATPRNDMKAVFLTGIPGINQSPGPDTVAEIMRLNVTIPPTPIATQNSLGVIGGDLAGFPNGRRPIDDVIDIALQVVAAGILCGPAYKGGFGCNTTNAPIYNVALTDGSPTNQANLLPIFPYLNYPYPGYGNGTQNYYPQPSPSAGPSFPSILAICIAIVAGFFISFAFFAF